MVSAVGGSVLTGGIEGVGASQGMVGGDLRGDWQCPNTACINHTKMVFASKTMCPKCGTPKPGTVGSMGGGCMAGGMVGNMAGNMAGGMNSMGCMGSMGSMGGSAGGCGMA